jgi:hypothetical protein
MEWITAGATLLILWHLGSWLDARAAQQARIERKIQALLDKED